MISVISSKAWHGSPMATLMRAFLILDSPILGGAIPVEQRALLRNLQDLYLRSDPLPQSTKTAITTTPGRTNIVTTDSSTQDIALTQDIQPDASCAAQQEQEGQMLGDHESGVTIETRKRRNIDQDERILKRLCHNLKPI